MPAPDLILANRAYLDHDVPRGGTAASAAVNGGLLAAVRPVIAPWSGGEGTTWIGAGRGRYDPEWTDDAGYELLDTPRGPLRHRRLFFDDSTWQGHYSEVSNSFLWPLLHLVREPLPDVTAYYPTPSVPTPAGWDAYRRVNLSFAIAASQERTTGRAWVHDYQLALAPAMLRNLGFAGRIGYFLHTPFPRFRVASRYLGEAGVEYLRQFVHGILGADLTGFQSPDDVERFSECAAALCGATSVSGGLSYDGRLVRTGVYPVGIDTEDLLEVARSARPPEVAGALLSSGQPLVVGLERADFTKGIPERLAAVADAYRRGARFAYAGIAAPTRPGVAAYDAISEAIETAAAATAAVAHETGNHFLHTHVAVTWEEVVALQREAQVVFTSSLADGLNLVPVQAAIAQSLRLPHERAVVLTGRDAGVARAFAGFETDGLVPVDPLDADDLTRALLEALAGRPGRVSDRLIGEIRRNDALAWATRFLTDLEA